MLVTSALLTLTACGGTTGVDAGSSSKGSSGGSQSALAASNPLKDAQAALDDTFGSFSPISKAGRSDAVVKLPAGIKAGLVTMTYKGSSNFIVDVLDSSNQSTGEGLANEIGSWTGSAPFGIQSLGSDAAKIQIQAQGAWTIKITPLSAAPQIKFPAAGKGTGVFLYLGEASDWTLTHKGQANFIVDETGTDGTNNNLVNEIGKYAGTVPAAAGPALVAVQADGTWTIKGA